MEPNIKYCSYMVNSEDTPTGEEVQMEVDLMRMYQQKLTELELMDEEVTEESFSVLVGDVIGWKGERIPIKNDKIKHCARDVLEFDQKVPDSALDVEMKHMEPEFSKIFKTLDSTVTIVRNELSELTSKRGLQAASHQEVTLPQIRDYFSLSKSEV
eukprot:TRINITY_DN7082_c0_g1_i1.p2 TRINITY_DN7082_c0_g1~~TRINITY_DN7082_c0_g1_i1.p2  ORF type:complete len:156 (+),score=31.95 TRINITY_DN7082_c0_g1_i1:153-620(+)